VRLPIFILGALILVSSFAVYAYDKPKVELIENAMGGLALINEEVRASYQTLQEEIFFAMIGMVVGVIIMIPGIILHKKKKT